jgi:hypothetical protein
VPLIERLIGAIEDNTAARDKTSMADGTTKTIISGLIGIGKS